MKKDSKDSLGDRMKLYENAEADRRFMPMLPICARIDGRSFHTFTKGFKRPYDPVISDLMQETTRYLVEETNACIGYTQSDEITLIWYSDDPKSQVFFDGRISKMTSVLASMASVKFNQLLGRKCNDVVGAAVNHLEQKEFDKLVEFWTKKVHSLPVFDARVWTVPNTSEAINLLIWREQDAVKNSISMAARAFYSDKELFGKNGSEKQEMLFQKGVNWDTYPAFFKRGVYFQRRSVNRKFTTTELDKLPPKHKARTDPNLVVERTDVVLLDMPPLGKITNRWGLVFAGEEPQTIASEWRAQKDVADLLA